MTKGDLFRSWRELPEEDRRTFECWAKVNAAIGAFALLAFVGITLAFNNSLGPRYALAGTSKAAAFATAARQILQPPAAPTSP